MGAWDQALEKDVPRSGSPYGRCCRYTGTVTRGDTAWACHHRHPVLTGTAHRHWATSRHPRISSDKQE